eukprot:TRINITY_DN8947_c0_g1_i2.p2 TRINITY_DN8947_c0_g1~~TRINITY_DN8947_c0_g1_i2.p2  ORF type:complete len:191 (-),score=21.01 TRINITY_DN8947_c0_g1_i2:360-932(-)
MTTVIAVSAAQQPAQQTQQVTHWLVSPARHPILGEPLVAFVLGNVGVAAVGTVGMAAPLRGGETNDTMLGKPELLMVEPRQFGTSGPAPVSVLLDREGCNVTSSTDVDGSLLAEATETSPTPVEERNESLGDNVTPHDASRFAAAGQVTRDDGCITTCRWGTPPGHPCEPRGLAGDTGEPVLAADGSPGL